MDKSLGSGGFETVMSVRRVDGEVCISELTQFSVIGIWHQPCVLSSNAAPDPMAERVVNEVMPCALDFSTRREGLEDPKEHFEHSCYLECNCMRMTSIAWNVTVLC